MPSIGPELHGPITVVNVVRQWRHAPSPVQAAVRVMAAARIGRRVGGPDWGSAGRGTYWCALVQLFSRGLHRVVQPGAKTRVAVLARFLDQMGGPGADQERELRREAELFICLIMVMRGGVGRAKTASDVGGLGLQMRSEKSLPRGVLACTGTW